MKVSVSVQPNAKKSEIVEYSDQKVKVRIKASPIENKANLELISFLSEILGIAKSDIAVISGKTSKNKIVAIENLDLNRFNEIIQKSFDK
jgi:uncharacterized protein (TIGR00251 family)